jgi:hypothetical protein
MLMNYATSAAMVRCAAGGSRRRYRILAGAISHCA